MQTLILTLQNKRKNKTEYTTWFTLEGRQCE